MRRVGQPNTGPGYYWRDYNGQIPRDAVAGGHDASRRPTYIGQAYVGNLGIMPGIIYPGVMGIKLPHSWKAHYSDIGVKILCAANLQCFSWQSAKKETLHMTSIGKQLVVGGYENGRNILNIGRAMFQNELVIGKVLGYNAGRASMHFVSGDKEHAVDTYEVLVYYN